MEVVLHVNIVLHSGGPQKKSINAKYIFPLFYLTNFCRPEEVKTITINMILC